MRSSTTSCRSRPCWHDAPLLLHVSFSLLMTFFPRVQSQAPHLAVFCLLIHSNDFRSIRRGHTFIRCAHMSVQVDLGQSDAHLAFSKERVSGHPEGTTELGIHRE